MHGQHLVTSDQGLNRYGNDDPRQKSVTACFVGPFLPDSRGIRQHKPRLSGGWLTAHTSRSCLRRRSSARWGLLAKRRSCCRPAEFDAWQFDRGRRVGGSEGRAGPFRSAVRGLCPGFGRSLCLKASKCRVCGVFCA